MRHAIWDHISADTTQATQHRTFADAHDLPPRNAAAKQDVIADLDMTSEHGVIREHDLVADAAIVRDVRIDHEHATVADTRETAEILRPRVHRHVLADVAVCTDDELSGTAAISDRLRRRAQRGERRDLGTRPDAGVPGHVHMRHEPAAIADADI